MVHELYCEPKNGTIMGSFIENINDDFDITTEKEKKKKDAGKTVQKPFQNCSIFLPKTIASKRYIYVTSVL